MNIQTASVAPHPVIPPEVVAFAREQGVEQYLPGLVELSHSTFSSASRFHILLEGDPEIADDWHIVFRLAVPLDVPQSLAADRQWIEGLYHLCPKPLVCIFRLSLDLVS
ncbi:MAG: hypothetical protein ACRELG_22250 [Gemmataceae bacterium]